MGKLMGLVQNIWKAKDFAKVMLITLDSLQQIFSCHTGIFVMLDPHLLTKSELRNTPDLCLTGQYVENMEIQVVQSAN